MLEVFLLSHQLAKVLPVICNSDFSIKCVLRVKTHATALSLLSFISFVAIPREILVLSDHVGPS